MISSSRRASARVRLTFGGAQQQRVSPRTAERRAGWRGMSIFSRGGRRKYKRSSQQESVDYETDNGSIISHLQENVMSDEEPFLDGTHPDEDVQPLLPRGGVMSVQQGGGRNNNNGVV